MGVSNLIFAVILAVALGKMDAGGYRHLPVVRHGELLGLVVRHEALQAGYVVHGGQRLFQRGAFDAASTQASTSALMFLAPGLVAFSVVNTR